MTGYVQPKAEWLAQYLDALWTLVTRAEEPKTELEPGDAVATSGGIARTTAAHHPAHLRLSTQDRVLLPPSEGRVWSLYGGRSARDESGYAGDALSSVIMQLLTLQPEAAGHLRCLAWGAGAADLLVPGLVGSRVGEVLRLLRGVEALRADLRCRLGSSASEPVSDLVQAQSALDDADREPWLQAIGRWLADHRAQGGVMSCSALKRTYRDTLREHVPDLALLHLDGTREVIAKRQASRPGHFMPASLLDSQFKTLEPLAADEHGVVIDVDQSIDAIVDQYVNQEDPA